MTRRLKLLLLPLLLWKLLLPHLLLKLLLLPPLKLPHLLLMLLQLPLLKLLLPPLLTLTPPRPTLMPLPALLLPSKQLLKQAKGSGPEQKKPHHGAVFFIAAGPPQGNKAPLWGQRAHVSGQAWGLFYARFFRFKGWRCAWKALMV